MKPRHIVGACVAASLIVLPAIEAAAADRKVVVIGGPKARAVAKERWKDRQRRLAARPVAPAVPSATIIENREIQTALNYFGFPAGVVDGVIGQNTRNAVSQYQGFMGYPITGTLAPYEKDFLVSSYHRAIAGGAVTAQMAASSPMGARGLLKSYQQELVAGTPMPPQPMPQAMPVQPVPQMAPTVVPVPAPAMTAPAAAMPAPTPSLPNFMVESAGPSLASHCTSINTRSVANGGLTSLATMSDPAFALNEQFCLARNQAVSDGEALASKVAQMTPSMVAAQCEGLGPLLQEHVAAVATRSPGEVLQGVNAFIQNSGMAPAQLAGTAKICLSAGYKADDMNVSIGSALLLVALGEESYAELPGHHLAQGFGVARQPGLALSWYETALGAIETGATPVFAPGQPERNALIRKAANQLAGRGSGPNVQGSVNQPAALPSFSFEN